MCEPITMMAVAGVAQTVYSISAQANQAKAQNAAIAQQLAVTNEEARRKATAQIFDDSRAARREQGRIRAAAGEAGLALVGSVDALLLDSAMQAEFNHGRSIANQESRTAANVAEATAAYTNVNNINGWSAGLQLAGAGLSGWAGIENAKIQKRAASGRAG